ncbi:hypothetical protein O3M35_005644 [Rhynocoris fuscipes]|uniref:Cytochrome P450 n=1 Tax=Rhynocoris fuscipes TaxID=488301 RepID=A0AAW1DK81_9HEMI
MLVFTVLISTVVSYIIWRLVLFISWVNRTSNIAQNIPLMPVIQNMINYYKIKNSQEMYDTFIRECGIYMDKENQIVRNWVGVKHVVSLGNPKHIETVLSSHDAAQKDSSYEYFNLYQSGLFTLNGSRWAELRKPLNKILTKPMIESNLGVFNEKAIKLSDVLSKFAENGDTVDMRHYLANYSVDTISITGYGHNLNELENNKWNLSKNLDSAIAIILKMMVKVPYCLGLAVAKHTKEAQKVRGYAKYVLDACTEVMNGRLETKKKSGETIIGGEQLLYSDVLIEAAKKYNLNQQQTANLAVDFLIAGFDTSSVVVATILLMLAIFPEHEEGVYNEQVNLVGDDTSVPLTWEQLSNMHYLTRVIKETVRLHCPPFIGRIASNDIDLGKHKIPKGSVILIALYLLHRNPSCWSHPTEFYPDHFLREETATRPKSAYYPFSWGPRSCPGKLYSMISMKVVLSILIRKYKFETDLKFEDLKHKNGLLLEIAQGYHLRIKPRHPKSQ